MEVGSTRELYCHTLSAGAKAKDSSSVWAFLVLCSSLPDTCPFPSLGSKDLTVGPSPGMVKRFPQLFLGCAPLVLKFPPVVSREGSTVRGRAGLPSALSSSVACGPGKLCDTTHLLLWLPFPFHTNCSQSRVYLVFSFTLQFSSCNMCMRVPVLGQFFCSCLKELL